MTVYVRISHVTGHKCRRNGIFALKALSLLADREMISVAIKNLNHHAADALETLESIRDAALIPLNKNLLDSVWRNQ